MFSFHKPKVYRSSTGCCICKAKSSSSRFTDSKKYEEDFLECFQLVAPRQGEICNACVLLVKRWKKLPAGSDRNWRHVVDARAGPGMKSITKFKSKNKKSPSDKDNPCEKIEKIMKKKKRKLERETSPALSDGSGASATKEDTELAEVDFLVEGGGGSGGSSRTNSPGLIGSDCEEREGRRSKSSRRHKTLAKRREHMREVSGFVDLAFWKPETLCCGTIFRGTNGAILIDKSFLKPCPARLAMLCKLPTLSPNDSQASSSPSEHEKTDLQTSSDSSSDSGYDESSNQGKDEFCNKQNSTTNNTNCLTTTTLQVHTN